MTQFERVIPESDNFALERDWFGGVILGSTSCKHQVQNIYIESRVDTSAAGETHDSHRYASKRGPALTG